jgi:hypothetical protein
VDGQPWTSADRRAGGAPGPEIYAARRTAIQFPPTDNNRFGATYTTFCGTAVRIEIERATGALRIAKAYSVLDCGQALVPNLVLGQAQGGFAMAVGYALLENLPPFETGPGNGQWNLGATHRAWLGYAATRLEIDCRRRSMRKQRQGAAEVSLIRWRSAAERSSRDRQAPSIAAGDREMFGSIS